MFSSDNGELGDDFSHRAADGKGVGGARRRAEGEDGECHRTGEVAIRMPGDTTRVAVVRIGGNIGHSEEQD